jgi:hypothetical protein
MFQRGPVVLAARGTATDDKPAFAVTDRNYLSARWPGDAYLFARRFCALLASAARSLTIRRAETTLGERALNIFSFEGQRAGHRPD